MCFCKMHPLFSCIPLQEYEVQQLLHRVWVRPSLRTTLLGGWAHGPRVHRIEEVVTLPRPIQGVNGKLKLWPVCREATAGIECAERVCAAIRASQAAKFSRSFAGRK